MAFCDIVGHRRILGFLSRAVARGTLPPSLLFAGPEGVGKRLAATSLAQALNCPSPVTTEAAPPGGPNGGATTSALTPEAASKGGSSERGGRQPFEHDACGVCSTCQRIARRSHADVLVIEPADTGTIRIEQVRDAIEATAYRPFEGKRRVVIVDEADAMLGPPQNALLKTLEEPASSSVFVLVSSRPDVLLPTVRSRCSRVRFAGLDVGEIAGVLESRCGLSASDARVVASNADGSLGRALQAAAGDLVEARAAAHGLLTSLARTPDARAGLEAAKLIKPAERIDAALERELLAIRCRAMASLLRDLEVLSTGADERALANRDLLPDLRTLARSYDRVRTLRAFSAVDRALGALERNASPKIVADWLALQL